MPWPQSRSQPAGLGGGAHVRSRMSHRVFDASTSQPMLLDGALKLVSARSGASVVVVAPAVVAFGAPAATVISGAVVTVVVSEAVFLPLPDEQLASTANARTAAKTTLTSTLLS